MLDSGSNLPTIIETQMQSSNSLLSVKGNNKSTDVPVHQNQWHQISNPPIPPANPKDILRIVKLSKAEINIEICDISYNAKNGISMNNVRLSIKQSRIQNNGNNAISLNELNKFLLKILATKCFSGHQLQQQKLIQGKIGGSWGSPPDPFKTKQQFESSYDAQEESKLLYKNKNINQISSANVFDDKNVRKAESQHDKRNKNAPLQRKRFKSGCCFPTSNKSVVEKRSQQQSKAQDKDLFTNQGKLGLFDKQRILHH